MKYNVFYNPRNVKKSVLETNIRFGLLLPLFIGGVMLGTTIAAILNWSEM